MGGEVPKQFRDWHGVPLLLATVRAFFAPGMPAILAVVLAVPEDRVEAVRAWRLPVPLRVVAGGGTRQESVASALAALEGLAVAPGTPVLIHDGVRPFPPVREVGEAIAALEAPGDPGSFDGALLAEASTDTLKRVGPGGLVLATEPRDRIFRAQTPQVATLATWRRAFAWAAETGFQGTDDVSILEGMGLRVKVVPSPGTNLKLTVPGDWERVQALEPQGVVQAPTRVPGEF
jgi:2-C-methyl-D-erythritol 4-phosphate cytidylyltransferase